ncbi:glycosyltransferase [Streptococcus entericus]|uniref:glycosyltransferase n=1 Tax=Streptococcus entericus TaxID=155680 RepID=UPI00037370D6|nr:glycosyltransferase [Streptococcus entericus]
MSNQHTFVICAYGESLYLEECIQSLKQQTRSSELILYTSTPNDLIEGLCQRYGIPLKTKPGGGIGKDWNNALSFVETPYATIAHQDDVYLPDFLEKTLSAFEKHPDSLITYTDYAELQDDKVRPENLNLKIKTGLLRFLALAPSSRFWRNRSLAFGNAICCPAVSYNLRALQGFSFSETLKTSLDWYGWYTISSTYSGRFSYIPDKLMYHRIHEESETTATIKDNTRTKEDLFMYEQFWPKWVAKLLIPHYEKSQASNH